MFRLRAVVGFAFHAFATRTRWTVLARLAPGGILAAGGTRRITALESWSACTATLGSGARVASRRGSVATRARCTAFFSLAPRGAFARALAAAGARGVSTFESGAVAAGPRRPGAVIASWFKAFTASTRCCGAFAGLAPCAALVRCRTCVILALEAWAIRRWTVRSGAITLRSSRALAIGIGTLGRLAAGTGRTSCGALCGFAPRAFVIIAARRLAGGGTASGAIAGFGTVVRAFARRAAPRRAAASRGGLHWARMIAGGDVTR